MKPWGFQNRGFVIFGGGEVWGNIRSLRNDKTIFDLAPLQKRVGIFVVQILKDLPGIFLEDFSGHFFTPNEEK